MTQPWALAGAFRHVMAGDWPGAGSPDSPMTMGEDLPEKEVPNFRTQSEGGR